MTDRPLHLSPTAIAAFKSCPTRFRLGWVEGIRKEEDTDTQRMGTNWHAMHEVYRNAEQDPDQHGLDKAMKHLDMAYHEIPASKTPEEWATERMILAVSFMGYLNYYQDDLINTVATEVQFSLPLHMPKTGLPLPLAEVQRVGKIDRIIERNGRYGIADYKSTSKPIDADSPFWSHLRLDTQVNSYLLAVQDLHATGQLDVPERPSFAFYDVWAKPKIKPSLLTQGETATFLKDGMYFGQKFEVTTDPIKVDGENVEVKEGAKDKFAIRETPRMFGARLASLIAANPAEYFARREIPRTDADMREFRADLYNVYQAMKAMKQNGHYFKNEHACEATFKCPYIPICYNRDVQEKVLAGETPGGFKRIFTEMTIGET